MSAAVAGAIGSALSSFFSGLFSYFATERTNKQNQQNYEDWKQYNSPANQMERLTDAGLNPYMINGVSNTLSQPFSVQNNQGISSGLSQLSQALSQGVSGINRAEANDIRRSSVEINRGQLELNKEAIKLRERMTRVAEKKGDAMTALLWSQGSIADLNAKFWKDMDDVRRNRYISDATIAASNADFLSEFNPLRLGYYRDFYPLALESQIARNSYTRAQTSQLYWSRAFMQEKLDQMMALGWARANNAYDLGMLNNQLGWARLGQDWKLGSGRLDLQRDYYSLARKKWITGSLLGLRGQNMNFMEHFIPKF